jgi:hypothetical protein
MKLQKDWNEYGGSVFDFEILETLEKKPEETDREFSDNLGILRELWQEKFDPAFSY